jgi:hypothetical protein
VINYKLVDVFNNAQHRVRAGWVSDLERWVLDGFMIVCGLERDRYRPVWVEGNYACGRFEYVFGIMLARTESGVKRKERQLDV